MFLTNHAHVLLCIAHDRQITTRQIAQHVQVTERAVHGIVRDLKDAGYLSSLRHGRRNVYPDQPLRHPEHSTMTIADLFAIIH